VKNFMLISLAATGLVPVAAVAQPTPAAAPAPPTASAPQRPIVAGLAVANVQDVIAASNAMTNAAKERQVVYKNQIAMAESRRKQINAEIAPLMAKFNADRQGGKVDQAELQRQAQAIQAMQQSGVQELQTMLAPVSLSETYVQEQVGEVINKAITNAMDKHGVTFVVPPQSVLAFNNAYNLSPAVLTELNALLPVAKVAPPQGWQPRAVREAQAAQQAQLQGQRAEPAKRSTGR
jgi:Skp family chaperone for outer membrane proteins